MLITVLDQHQNPLAQRQPSPLDPGFAGPAHHKQPLIRAPMTIPRTAFSVTGSDNHFSRLRTSIAERDPE